MVELPTNPVVFGYPGAAWEPGLGRQTALMHALADFVPVVFLLGARPNKLPRPRPLRLEQRSERLFLVHHVHQWQRTGLGRRLRNFASTVDGAQLHRFLCRQGLGDYVFWLLHDELDRWRGMDLRRLVFDSIDPCMKPQWQQGHDRRERELARRAKVVFCTAGTLLDRARPLNPASYLLPNACASESFVKASVIEKAPTVGYLGTFDERVDVRFLESLAEQLTDVRFVLAGRINRDQEQRLARLRSMSNVDVRGAVSFEEGHRLLGTFSVGLVPFLAGPMGDAINPVKMYTYLAAGTPVVATAIRECQALEPPLVWSSGLPSAVTNARAALASAERPGERAVRIEWAKHNTWRNRAMEAVAVLRQHGLLPATAERLADDHTQPDQAELDRLTDAQYSKSTYVEASR